jgi:hypothetical protein
LFFVFVLRAIVELKSKCQMVFRLGGDYKTFHWIYTAIS